MERSIIKAMDKRVLLTFLTFLALVAASAAAIAYNKGYRPNFANSGKPVIEAQGLLVADSSPNGAQVLINDKLTTATDDTLNLSPGEYSVKLIKDGYIPWEKRLKIQTGVVTETQARLFPTAPSLRAETSTGALLPTLSPDNTKLVYGVASGSAEKRGIWVMDLTDRPLLTQAQSRQIAENPFLAQAVFTWSPDSKQIIASINNKIYYLLDADRFNPNPKDITASLNLLVESWKKEIKTRENTHLGNLKPALLKELSKMNIIAWSPDETKILYSASQSATLPPILEKPLLGASTQKEKRDLKKGEIYVYDLKEDRNFLIQEGQNKPEVKAPTAFKSAIEGLNASQKVQPLSWFPDSRHLIGVEESGISLFEYDGTNKNTIYSGPFENSFVFPWPNGNKLIILTTYNRPTGVISNLYTISLQ